MNFRVFNDFKRRLLAGEVENKFNCTAYLLNSAYETIMENNLYARTIDDFAKVNSAALRCADNTLIGNAVENCSVYQNTYYRVPDVSEDDEDTGMYSIVNSANISAFSAILGVSGNFSASRFNTYLQQYSYFYLVSRADEFSRLVRDCKDNDYETFAVVLGDDIEHVVVDSTCFGSSRAKPFRGVFDGNGYTLHIAGINAKKRSNGIFGYISEEGVVRNLVIKADELSNNTNNTITIQNSNAISLDTIKTGEGDVKIGVLAGVNNGTVENVLLSANIIYDGNYTPEVYFVQNKSNSTRVISNAWMQLPASLRGSLANSTALSSFDNFFYPTQLCINSYANVIPYVGYFNEGCINHSTTNKDKLDEPMYTLQRSNTKYTDRGNSLYMLDIAKYNYDKVYNKIEDVLDDKTYVEYNDWYLNHAGYESSNRISAATTFRMGPNNKQAYLLGALVGLNNGNLTNVAVKSVTTFDTNTVALIGGIAGRGGRGILSGVYVNTHFSANSAMYDYDISVQSEHIVTASKQNFYLPKSGTNLYNYKNPGKHTLNITYDTAGYSELVGTDEVSALYVASTVGSDDILAVVSAEASYEGKVTQDKSTIYAMARTTAPLEIFGDEVEPTDRVKHLFSLVYTSATVRKPGDIQLSAVFHDKNMNQDFTAACKIYDVIVDDYYGTCKDSVHSTSSIMIIDEKTEYNYADGNTLSFVPSITLCFSGNYGFGNLSEVTGYVKMPLEDVAMNQASAIDNNNFTTSAYNTDFKINLPPLVNIGGIFGEYVYSDAQQVVNAAAHVSARNFKSNNGYKQANCLSYFAANLTFDSSNKSNSDLYSATDFYSDHARVKNDLKCSACAIDSNNLRSPFADCTDMYTTAQFVHYLNMYNQIAPAIVSTQYTFNEHTKGETEPPALGSMYTDFNFYQFGLNMGSTSNDYDDPDEFGNFLITSANSGIYFNFPAQLQYYNNKESYAGNKGLWKYSTVITAAYNLAAGTQFTAFATKQLDTAPQHIPMYRGRSSIANDKVNVTFDVTAYNAVAVTAATGTVTNLNKRIDDVATIIKNSRSTVNDPIYIYTHSAKSVNTTVNHVPLTMYYTDYAIAGTSAFDYTIDDAVANAWLTANNSARCYALSSDSYAHVVVEPKYTGTRTYDDGTGVPISANSLVYGFIPTSSDVIRALNVAEDATLLCSGIKADHINYLLVVDSACRPIFDVELDVTAVDNDGYYIKFPQLYAEHITAAHDEESHSSGPRAKVLAAKPKLGGLAINIENGND